MVPPVYIISIEDRFIAEVIAALVPIYLYKDSNNLLSVFLFMQKNASEARFFLHMSGCAARSKEPKTKEATPKDSLFGSSLAA
jgi:hypothetical protein